jgi:hypothetical protein
MHGEIRAHLAHANPHSSVGNEFLDLRPGMIGQNRDEESIEPLPRGFSGNGEFHSVGSRPWAVGSGFAHRLAPYSL